MRSPWTELHLHLVWSTWQRAPLLVGEVRSEAYALIVAECHRQRSQVLALNGMDDHVHLLVRVPTTVAPAGLMKQVKGSSSHALNENRRWHGGFRWQGGYGAFAICKRHLEVVQRYVERQEMHHRTGRIYRLLEPPPEGMR